MFEKLKAKWEVNTLSLVLILCTFAVGGSLCGYLAKWFLGLFQLNSGLLKIIAYCILVTLLWPLCVLLLSLFTGQFLFFKKYIRKIFEKIF